MDEYDEGLLAGDLMHTINNDARNLEAIDNMLQILGINYQFKYGSTPLMIASHNEDYRLVQFLLENGANPNIIKNEDGETALFNGLEDYEITKLENGNSLAKFSVATNESYLNKAGDRIENTQWHNIIAWGKTAEIVEKILKKGNEVVVDGKLINRSYEDDKGVTRYITEIQASELLKISAKD